MGFFDKIFGSKNELEERNNSQTLDFNALIEALIYEQALINDRFYEVKLSNLETFNNKIAPLETKVLVELIVFCIHKKYRIVIGSTYNSKGQIDLKQQYNSNYVTICVELTNIFFVSHHAFNSNELVKIINALFSVESIDHYIRSWRLANFVRKIEKYLDENDIDPGLEKAIDLLRKELRNHYSKYQNLELEKLWIKLNSLVKNNKGEEDEVLFLEKEDYFSPFANQLIKSKPHSERLVWYQIILLIQNATSSKPSKKFLNESENMVSEIGEEKFKHLLHEFFNFLIQLKEEERVITRIHGGHTYTYRSNIFLDANNIESLKGLIWMFSTCCEKEDLKIISQLAERCFKKIPSKGQAASAVGNACLYVMASFNGMEGIGQLSRLKVRIKQASTHKIIEKYLVEAAEKSGMTPAEIEDIAVDDFKIVEGKRVFELGDFKAVIELISCGKSTLTWYKEDGKEQKSVPASVKSLFPKELKEIKEIQKGIDQGTSTQRDRFDRMIRDDREITLKYFLDNYRTNGLLKFVTQNLIFTFFRKDENFDLINYNMYWIDVNGASHDISQYEKVKLWHPAKSTTTEVKKWREFLVEKQLLQPFKQAYREIYLLTEAELNTRVYSNRMASHILKQHQYVTLAKGRNWKARLLGSWDGGDLDTATLDLFAYNIQVQYWVNAVSQDNAYNDTGIWNYVSTDQIRFINMNNAEVMELIDVPPIAFSEALRDVDLFVGVASVGNDPTWQDTGGEGRFTNYWHQYSFGDLSAIAKNRYEILENLVPKLKIAKVAHLDGKFLVVKGKLRTYKIHVGSTNILMSPNDQYLCIVPAREKSSVLDKVFLPFEGDAGLSIILSKAMLLADDDKITDRTITSQINRIS